jgi:serine/threonine protein kinase
MWPTPQDYNEALQNPRLCFEDEDLRAAVAEVDKLGLPRAICGSFASVYHVSSGGRQLAVRCFLHHFTDQQQRYAAISEFLSKHTLPAAVSFRFLTRGIRVREQWFPSLKMDWVVGDNLTDWVRQHVDDHAALSSMCEKFLELCGDLSALGIAHGDLQHGNILVSPSGRLKLVDYDGMYVPALSGLQSHELGHRHYQHPQRTRRHFGTYLDNFSAWSIYTSLICLAQDPRLLERVGGGDECLLFRQSDYDRPDASTTLHALQAHDDGAIRDAARTLREVLSTPIEQVPPLQIDASPKERRHPAGIDELPNEPAGRRRPTVSRQDAGAPLLAALHVADPIELVTPKPSESPAKLLPAPSTVASQQHIHVTGGGKRNGWRFPTMPLVQFELWLASLVAAVLITHWIGRWQPKVHVLPAPATGSSVDQISMINDLDYLDGNAEFNAKHLPAAIACYTTALASFTRQHNQVGMAHCAYKIGVCHSLLNEDSLAIDWLDASINRYAAASYIPVANADLGWLYAKNNELNKAVPYLERALAQGVYSGRINDRTVSATLKSVALRLLDNKQLDALNAYKVAVAFEHSLGFANLKADQDALNTVAKRLAQSTEPELAKPVEQLANELMEKPPAIPNPRQP